MPAKGGEIEHAAQKRPFTYHNGMRWPETGDLFGNTRMPGFEIQDRSCLDPVCASVRFPVTAALATALLASRAMGWCSSARLDLDPLVTASMRETCQ